MSIEQEPVELFYSYAHADETLRKKLEEHLSLLRREGYISEWHDRMVSPGSIWAQEIDTHLQAARIILLLISPSFIASDYCYGTELQEAMSRHKAGEARVVPIILRACDWETAPFGKLDALPKNAKPVRRWTDLDVAFTDIAKSIRIIVDEFNSKSPVALSQAADIGKASTTSTKGGEEVSKKKGMVSTPEMLKTPASLNAAMKKAIERYYKELKAYEGKADYELALRSAFQNLLADCARQFKWTLIPEQTIEGGIRPDGVLRDEFDLQRGFWEAKGPKSDLEKEIAKKIADKYPLTNTIFENTRRAILYQNKKRVSFEYNLHNPKEIGDLLKQFLTYTEPHIEDFEAAVEEFKERIPELAKVVLAIIDSEPKLNKKFVTAFENFAAICRTSLNPQIGTEAIKEMLVQHLLTERLFRTIFGNNDFVNRNVIAAEIEKVIQALTSRAFNRQEFLRSLDRFYVSIEGAAKGIESWSERQQFLNTVYERFFQGFSVKQADTHGIVYTPQEIVDFMCNSVEVVLQREFGTSIAEPGVQILDPATGTGNFIVNLMQHHIPRSKLKYKYKNDLFCNEVTLLPYYIASLNIEHEYYESMKEYEPFEGICFADTLELAEGQQMPLFVEENTERVKREKDAQIMVVIGNPPYNVGQKNENDNNKNRKYEVIDKRIHDTYVKGSKATLNTQLYDAYVRFFRWATDRLGDRDGIVCLVSNNSFIDQITFDGMRQHLLRDFSYIYHIDLHGNIRKNSKLSGTTHNIFGIQVGVGITIAVRLSKVPIHTIYYYRVPEYWRKTEKLAFLQEKNNTYNIEWRKLYPDEKYNWLTEGLRSEFSVFLASGTKEAKNSKYLETIRTIFKTYSTGINSGRDSFVYDFSKEMLKNKIQQFSEEYNAELSRWVRKGRTKDIDNFVRYDKLKWSRNLKRDLQHERNIDFDQMNIRAAIYRPFTKLWLYYADIIIDEQGTTKTHFPTVNTELENIVICVPGLGNRREFGCLAANAIPSMDLAFEKVQCFPYYIYSTDGTNHRENITDWSLAQFQAKYGSNVTKWDIFHYVYAVLHHPQYRERYAENLKRDLPHIPLLHTTEAFTACVNIGKQLMELHLNYEQAPEYKQLAWFENKDVPFSWRVEKMRLSSDKRVVVVNDSLRLGPVPPECFEYRLGNRSALEWVLDQYQVSKDQRSGIESDPNRLDDEEYIVRLVGKVVTVSVETVRLVKELVQAVTMEDWLEKAVQLDEPIQTEGNIAEYS